MSIASTPHAPARQPARRRRLGALIRNPRTFPVLQQGIFTFVLLSVTLLLVVWRPESVAMASLSAGWALLGLAALLSLAVLRIPGRWLADLLIPLIGFAALGVCRLATLPDGAAVSTLAFFPAIRLIVSYRGRGAALSMAAVLLSISVPSLISGVALHDPAQIGLFAILPITVLMVGVLLADLLSRLDLIAQRERRSLSARLEATKAAARSAAILQSASETINVGFLILTPDGRSILQNPAYEALLDLLVPEGSARDTPESAYLLFRPDGTTPLPDRDRPAARVLRGESFDNMLMLVGPPGPTQRAISMSGRSMRGDASLTRHSLLVSYDVTDTQRLIHEREQFIAMVSHELRTPLTSIVGYAELAIDEVDSLTPPSETIGEYLDIIRRNSAQLSALVEDLLLEQQSRSGSLPLQATRFRLDVLLHKVVASLKPRAAERQLSLLITTDEPVEVIADQGRIAQVLDNLITNAVKYSNPGGEIRASATANAGQVEITVIDDGPGLAASDAAQLFTPFFRSARAAKSAQRGAGLGLTVVKSIIEAHGGTIGVETASGKGATFRIQIPQNGHASL